MKGRVLIIAGSDSGGGAGIQADVKSITALGGYAATAITALTAQDTTGVHGIHDVPVAFIVQQMRVVLDDIGADAIKTGMLHRAEVIEAVASTLAEHGAGIPLIVDPVMYAKGGACLLAEDAHRSLISALLPRARLVTPNVPEAEHLSGMAIKSVADMERAAGAILASGPETVLLKGGHLETAYVTDLLVGVGGVRRFTGPRIDSRHTHGTGCTLASAIAAGIAQGLDPDAAVEKARAYVFDAIRQAPGYGRGHGPLNHACTLLDESRTMARNGAAEATIANAPNAG